MKIWNNLLNTAECQNDDDTMHAELRVFMETEPNEFRQFEHDLSVVYANRIKAYLWKAEPRKLRFSSFLTINALAEALAEKVGGVYHIAVLQYDSLLQAWQEQNFRLQKVGHVSPKEYFALVDSEARQIGVHIPKSVRQIVLENEIPRALDSLEYFLKSKGIHTSRYIRTLLEWYLWKQMYPYKIGRIRVFATAQPLEGQVDSFKLKSGRELQMKFYCEESKLLYHIQCT